MIRRCAMKYFCGIFHADVEYHWFGFGSMLTKARWDNVVRQPARRISKKTPSAVALSNRM